MQAFSALDIRTGTVRSAEPLEGARKPAYRLTVDFGPAIGVKTSTAQITERYAPDALVGKQVLGVVNLPPKRVAGVTSEVLIVGVGDEDGAVILVAPDSRVADGARLY
jgi:tRNA-binding protein